MARDIYDHQGLVAAQAYWESWKKREGDSVEGLVGLYRLLKRPETERSVRFVLRALHEPEGSDLFQLHYYRSWRGLQAMLDWIHREMRDANAVRPVIAAEVGYYVKPTRREDSSGRTRTYINWRHYSEDDHARDLVKVFATLLGNGIGQALYWNMRDEDDRGATVRLFRATNDPQQFKPNRVNRAFRMLSHTLTGEHSAPAHLPARAGQYEFHFGGGVDVSIVWSEGEGLAAALDGARELRDIEGTVLSRSAIGPSFHGPVYAFW